MSEFDPSEHNIADVNDHLEKHPDELKAVLAAEKSGKNRTTLVEALEEQAKSVPENVGSPAVEVGAAEPTAEGTTSSDRHRTVNGDKYEVTPDRGYRKV